MPSAVTDAPGATADAAWLPQVYPECSVCWGGDVVRVSSQ